MEVDRLYRGTVDEWIALDELIVVSGSDERSVVDGATFIDEAARIVGETIGVGIFAVRFVITWKTTYTCQKTRPANTICFGATKEEDEDGRHL